MPSVEKKPKKKEQPRQQVTEERKMSNAVVDLLKQMAKEDKLEVGYELHLGDFADPDAIFQIAEIREKRIYLKRKFVLPEDYDKDMYEMADWLNGEYLRSLPEELKPFMVRRKRNRVFIPREAEVFGKHVYSNPEEAGKMWEIFKKAPNWKMVDEEGNSRWTWLASPAISGSARFCAVDTSGAPDYNDASTSYGVLPCFKLNREALAE